MAKKSTKKAGIHTLVHSLPYNRLASQEIWSYVEEHLLSQMDEHLVAKVAKILENPNWYQLTQLQPILPEIKTLLHINEEHLLKNSIKTKTQDVVQISNLIQWRCNFYTYQTTLSGLLLSSLEPDVGHDKLDVNWSYETKKKIIANILVLLLLQEEYTMTPSII